MEAASPNFQLNSPNAGNIASPIPLLPPAIGNATDPSIPSTKVDQANVIVALSILAIIGLFCVAASVILTRRSAMMTTLGGLQGMSHYGDWYPATDGYQRVRVPRLWDVMVASESKNSGKSSSHKQWESIRPLSAQTLPRSRPARAPPMTVLPDISRHARKVCVSVVIVLPSKGQAENSIPEYAIGTTDLSVLRSQKSRTIEELQRMYS